VLSEGANASDTVRDLVLEVRGTHELRERAFAAEAELDVIKRKLEVDARAELDRERAKAERLRKELEEKERSLQEAAFDLRRAQAASAQGEWDQQEEEVMRLTLANQRLVQELEASRQTERELADKLLEQEHRALELRFDYERALVRVPRLEERVVELEVLRAAAAGGGGPGQAPTAAGGDIGAAAGKAPSTTAAAVSRKDRDLQHVIEGLERVIGQQRSENEKLRLELKAKRDDRHPRGSEAAERARAEVQQLRQRVVELEVDLEQQRNAARSSEQQARADVDMALEQKDRRVQELEAQLRVAAVREGGAGLGSSSSSVPPVGGATAATLGQGAAGVELARLREELRQLEAERRADAMALDEAQRALQEAELTEQRYRDVARENKQLRADLSALEDAGFWGEIEALQARGEEAAGLIRESKDMLEQYVTSIPSLQPPVDLLHRLGFFAAAAAAAAA